MTACSAHKTLPVLTGGAWLNLANERFVPAAKDAMALFASTSPSYPVMASLDLCAQWLREHAATAYPKLERQVGEIRRLALREGFGLPQGPCDPTRISLYTPSVGLHGIQAAQFLRESGVEPEYADACYVVLIPTPWNPPEDWERLANALIQMPKGEPLPPPRRVLPPLPQTVMSLRDAVLSLQEEVPISQAVGRIAAVAACPCPPGVPVVMPGEKISQSAADFLCSYGFSFANVIQ